MIKKANRQAGKEGNMSTKQRKTHDHPKRPANDIHDRHVRITSVFGGSPAGSVGSDPLDLSLSPQQWALNTIA